MELLMAALDDSTPWAIPPALTCATAESWTLSPAQSLATSASKTTTHINSSQASDVPILHGRGFFSELGTVRRKPSRPDAPPTLSKSCSDKLALKQCTSLLSSITSMLIVPSGFYLSSLVLPESQYSKTACTRAFSSKGRMEEAQSRKWDGDYHFREFAILTTRKEFRYSRRQALVCGEKLMSSNISTSWMAQPLTRMGTLETLIGGVLQGRKQYDVRGASRVCKRRMWKLAVAIAGLAAIPTIEEGLQMATYGEVKKSHYLKNRRNVKEEVITGALKGWLRNGGGEQFEVDGAEI